MTIEASAVRSSGGARSVVEKTRRARTTPLPLAGGLAAEALAAEATSEAGARQASIRVLPEGESVRTASASRTGRACTGLADQAWTQRPESALAHAETLVRQGLARGWGSCLPRCTAASICSVCSETRS